MDYLHRSEETWYLKSTTSNSLPLCSHLLETCLRLQPFLFFFFACTVKCAAYFNLTILGSISSQTGTYLESVKLITISSTVMLYRAQVLSYADMIKLCLGELIRLDLHLEKVLCSRPLEASQGGCCNQCFLMTWHFSAGFPPVPAPHGQKKACPLIKAEGWHHAVFSIYDSLCDIKLLWAGEESGLFIRQVGKQIRDYRKIYAHRLWWH